MWQGIVSRVNQTKFASLPFSIGNRAKLYQWDDVLTRFRSNEVGKLCQTDRLVLEVGRRQFAKSAKHEISSQNNEGNLYESEKRWWSHKINAFLTILELSWDHLFGRAQMSIDLRRQETLRKPAEMSVEEDVVKLREYKISKINRMLQDPYNLWTSNTFNTLEPWWCAESPCLMSDVEGSQHVF